MGCRKICIKGQSGIFKKGFLEKALFTDDNTDIKYFSIGDEMYLEAEKSGEIIEDGKILNLSLTQLRTLRRSVFKDILHFCELNPETNVIVNTHSCFRWNYGLFFALDNDLLQEFNPDMYVTLIDDVDAIYLRLNERKDPHVREFTLKEILTWREEEVITTEVMALTQKKPFYILSRKNPIDTLSKLIFNDGLKKAYLSFPITKVRDKPKILELIQEFKSEMAKHLIVFDPITIEEKRLLSLMNEYGNTGHDEIIIETLGRKLTLKISELKMIEKDIDGQIISRDFRLIDQSDMIISFVPEIGGEPNISAGSQSEITYASSLPREVYVLWESEKELSVWVEQMATKVFQGNDCISKAIIYFKEKGYL